MRTIAQAIKDKRVAPVTEAPTWTVRINATDVTAKLLEGGLRDIDLEVEKKLGLVKPADFQVTFDDPVYIKTIANLNWTDTIAVDLGIGADKVTDYFKGYIDPDATTEDDLTITLIGVSEVKKLDRAGIGTPLGFRRFSTVRDLLSALTTSLGYTLTLPGDLTYDASAPATKEMSFLKYVQVPTAIGTLEASYGGRQNGLDGVYIAQKSSAVLIPGSGAYLWYYVIPVKHKVFAYGVKSAATGSNELILDKLWEIAETVTTRFMRVFNAATSGATGQVVFGSGNYLPVNDAGQNHTSVPQKFWKVTISTGVIDATGIFPTVAGQTATLESCGWFKETGAGGAGTDRIVMGTSADSPPANTEQLYMHYVNPATALVTFSSVVFSNTVTGSNRWMPRGGATQRLGTVWVHFMHAKGAAAIKNTNNEQYNFGVPAGNPVENSSTFIGPNGVDDRIYYVATDSTIVAINPSTAGQSSFTYSIDGLTLMETQWGGEAFPYSVVLGINNGTAKNTFKIYKFEQGISGASPAPVITSWSGFLPIPDQFDPDDLTVASRFRFGAPVNTSDNTLDWALMALSFEHLNLDSAFFGTGVLVVDDKITPSLVFNDFTLDANDSQRQFVEDAALASACYWRADKYQTIELKKRKITGAAAATFTEKDYEVNSFLIDRRRQADWAEVNGRFSGTVQFGGQPLSISIHWLPSNHASALAKTFNGLYAADRKAYSFDGNFLVELEPFDIITVPLSGTNYTGFVQKIVQEDTMTKVEIQEVFV